MRSLLLLFCLLLGVASSAVDEFLGKELASQDAPHMPGAQAVNLGGHPSHDVAAEAADTAFASADLNHNEAISLPEFRAYFQNTHEVCCVAAARERGGVWWGRVSMWRRKMFKKACTG